TSAGGTDVFVTKLDASGTFTWARRMGGTGADSASGIATDGWGSMFLAGTFAGTGQFDPGSGARYLVSAGGSDAFVTALAAPPDVVGRTASGQWYLGSNDASSFTFSPAGAWDESAGWRD